MNLFVCKRHVGDLRITKTFCGDSWNRAQTYTDPEDKIRLSACIGCKTGEKNAHGQVAPEAKLPLKYRFTVSPRGRTDVPSYVERKRKSRVAL